MPVTSLQLDFDWGYGPLHYFAPNERWGGVQGLKRLVNACHAAGVAAISAFGYSRIPWEIPFFFAYKKAPPPRSLTPPLLILDPPCPRLTASAPLSAYTNY